MKLEVPKPDPQFTLFSPETSLPTEERTQFRNRANDVFGSLSRDTVAPSDLSPAMAPTPPHPSSHRSASRREEKVNITPSIELYNTLVSDKIEKKRAPPRKPSRPFGTNKRFFRAQHEINSQKFTKYSLRDTDITDDRENKSIALSFLKDLRESKAKSESEPAAEDGKVVFRKRQRPSNPEVSEDKKGPSKHKNVIVQEEYVIGQTKSSSKRHVRAAGAVTTEQRKSSHDKQSSGKGKERGKITACYLDDNEEDELD